MDGNGRWAKSQGKPRVFGHKNGVKSVREVTEAAAEIGIKYLTLYAFSTENWSRPALEVNALMSLLVDTIGKELATLTKNNIRLQAIGDLSQLPNKTRDSLYQAIEDTSNHTRMTLVLALNYSARWDITEAAKKIANNTLSKSININAFTSEDFNQYLATKDIPDPELLIRTSGEQRISNFLLWQIAYSELYFTPVLWPDFRKNHFYDAIIDYQNRERRFGKTSDQILKTS